MHNEILKIGPLTIYGYGLMIAIGIVAAYLLGVYRAKKAKLDPNPISTIVVLAVVGGMVGARVLYLITIFREVLANPSLIWDVSNGFVVYGGIIAGILTIIAYCRIKKISFLAYFDLLMPSVALAQGFGRLGCFLAGCCYGRETNSVIGIVFHNSSYAPNGVRLIPTQLLSSGLNFLHCLLLVWVARHKKGDGQVGACYLIFYSIGRFILEFFRGDLERGAVGSLSTSQFISLFICVAGIALLIWRKDKWVRTGKEENHE